MDASAILLDQGLQQIDLVFFGKLASSDGCRFHPRCGDAKPQCSRIAPSFANGVACHLYGEDEAQEAAHGG